MKKKNIIIFYLIIILVIIFWWYFIYESNIFDSKNNIVKNIEKSLVIVIPEKKLIKFKENPEWIFWLGEESWIWMGFFTWDNWKILTVNHLVNDKMNNYIIKTYDWKEYLAQIFSRDEKNDLAILKINSEKKYIGLKILDNNPEINYQDEIISFWVDIKNFENDYIYWKVTNFNEKLDNVENLIEFFPVIKKGFSGWPILNMKWEIIWINYAINQNKSYGIKLPSIFPQL
jgi:serine protease Do